MAVWPSTIDDDGTGESGTGIDDAFFDLIKAYIDAGVGGIPRPVFGTFTPTDASGAGLVFPTKTGDYCLLDKLMIVWVEVVYPTTSNGAISGIGGLPFPSRGIKSGFYQSYGPAHVWHLAANTSVILPINAATMVQRTNAELSGGSFVLIGAYVAQ